MSCSQNNKNKPNVPQKHFNEGVRKKDIPLIKHYQQISYTNYNV